MKRAIVALLCCAMGTLAFVAAPALASGPQWTVTSVSKPTVFAPGDESGQDVYRVEVTNTGGTASDGTPVTVKVDLPAGLQLAPGASGEDQLAKAHSQPPNTNFDCELETCTFTGVVVPEDTLIVTFPVRVMTGGQETLTSTVQVAGGGAPDAIVRTPTAISSTPASFGFSPGGSSTSLSSVQAGAHPDITTTVAFDTINYKGSLAGLPKDLTTEEPPGFAGDLVDTPTCAPALFSRSKCPVDTQVGVTTLTLLGLSETAPHVESMAVYNLAPNPGEAAKFGFNVIKNYFIQGNVAVRPGDYGLKVSFHDTNQVGAQLDAVSLTIWGVPAAKVHDPWRYKIEPVTSNDHFGVESEVAPAPYFTNPTSCEGGHLVARMAVSSWEEPDAYAHAAMPFGPIVGCDRLALPASFFAEPTSEDTDTATGLNVNLNVKQTYENAEGLATSTLKQAVVTLPEGMTVNPSAGAGLAACTLAQYAEAGLEEVAGRGCPQESKLGTVEIETPSLPEKATGSVYLAQPAPHGEAGRNPFDSLLALYIVARFPERGVLVKVAGKVTPDPQTGRLITTFAGQPELAALPDGAAQPGLAGLPPVPFTHFVFKFHQGGTSPLVTPPLCGAYAGTVALNPWSAPLETLMPEPHPFTIAHGVAGGACPAGGTPPFSPTVVAGTNSNTAGAYSPFYLRIERKDGEQEITGFSTTMPPGITGNLSGIPFCSEADIAKVHGQSGAEAETNPACPAASQIGHTIAEAGVGTVLAQTPGRLYLAGPFEGAPFSVVNITSAKVGPFDLGTVVVHLPLHIDPLTAQVSIPSGPADQIPHIIDGIVIHLRTIRAYIDREHFMINPTSCSPLSVNAAVIGAGSNVESPADDVAAPVTDRFQAADCQALKFSPTFKVTTSAHTSRANGASLDTKVTVPAGSLGKLANIKSVKVDLPYQLPSRLTTLQKACTSKQFEANPAGCPGPSRVGTAVVHTPILPVPLTGPAYFVSYGAAKFPELIVVLQGYGITIMLHGETFISKKGITSTTFRSLPDSPFESFELSLPQGPYSALTNNGNLCKVTTTKTIKKRVKVKGKNGKTRTVTRKVRKKVAGKLLMPTALTAQNGAVIHETNTIAVSGCPKAHKPAKKKRKRKKKK